MLRDRLIKCLVKGWVNRAVSWWADIYGHIKYFFSSPTAVNQVSSSGLNQIPCSRELWNLTLLAYIRHLGNWLIALAGERILSWLFIREIILNCQIFESVAARRVCNRRLGFFVSKHVENFSSFNSRIVVIFRHVEMTCNLALTLALDSNSRSIEPSVIVHVGITWRILDGGVCITDAIRLNIGRRPFPNLLRISCVVV